MFIGLDIGTSGCKAAMIDIEGNVCKSKSRSYHFVNAEPGYRELDPEEIWNAVVFCIGSVANGQSVTSITVSCLGETVLPLNQNGEPLCNCITGTDCRGQMELQRCKELFSSKELVTITGLSHSIIFSCHKLGWLKNNRPDIYEHAWKIVTLQEFVIFRLSRALAVDTSLASRSMLLDVRTNHWSDEVLHKLGLVKDKLSPVFSAGTVVGHILPEMADLLSLKGEVAVVLGVHDHIANGLGCGVHKRGDCSNVVGTTEGITAIFQEGDVSLEQMCAQHISCQPFPAKNLFNTVAWSNTSGVLLSWYFKQFCHGTSCDTWLNSLNELLPSIDGTPTDLWVIPHFSGSATPYMNEKDKGAIVGLTLDTTQKDIFQAIMEGTNYELAHILSCSQSAKLNISRMISTGGALTPTLLQIKSDILGREIYTVKQQETGTLGSAMLGAVATGFFGSIGEVVDEFVHTDTIYTPRLEYTSIHQEKQQIYTELYNSLSLVIGK